MRKFKLINANGTEWDLMRKDAFFHAPEGLGMGRSFSCVQAGFDFLEAQSVLMQKNINGEMVFGDYGTYTDFVTFISRDPLTLLYSTKSRWYQISCKVQSMDKGEKAGQVLIIPISFLCFGIWRENVIIKQADNFGAECKIYPYTYDYSYSEASSGRVVIHNGDLESPCKLHIFGPVTNPSWALYKAGQIVLDGKVLLSIPAGNKLVVSAAPTVMEIAEYSQNNDFVKDHYQDSDFSTARFVYAPPGESTISFTHEGTGKIVAYVEVERLAYTV